MLPAAYCCVDMRRASDTARTVAADASKSPDTREFEGLSTRDDDDGGDEPGIKMSVISRAMVAGGDDGDSGSDDEYDDDDDADPELALRRSATTGARESADDVVEL